MTTKLPWHPTRMWGKRDLALIKYLVVHQSAVEASYENINKAHITPGPQNNLSANGAPHIAYHYGIEKTGRVLFMNPLYYVTWHCKNYNTVSVGINVNGNFSGNGWKGVSDPTKEQLVSLKELLAYLYTTTFTKLDPNTSLYGHSHFDPVNRPADPGYTLETFIKDYINSASSTVAVTIKNTKSNVITKEKD